MLSARRAMNVDAVCKKLGSPTDLAHHPLTQRCRESHQQQELP